MADDDDQADPAPEALVTTPVATKALGISARTLERYVTQNLVRPEVTLPSGQYRWRVSELVAAMHAGR